MGECTDKPNEKGGTPRTGESSPLIFNSAVGRIGVFDVATEAEARSDPGGAPLVESFKSRVNEWSPKNAALTVAAGDSDALETFYKEHNATEVEVRKHGKRYEETREPIAFDDAVALVRRIKMLHANPLFTGHDDFVAYLSGQCLTLKEGRSEGDVYAATVTLVTKDPPPGFPQLFPFKISISVKIQTGGAVLPFGVQTSAWLGSRLESFLRDRERQGFPPGSRSYHLFNGGDFTLVLDPARITEEPEEGAIPVVLAPNETTIREFISLAESSADHWDALVKVAAMLRRNRQPFGDALCDWLIEAAGRQARRPKGTTTAKRPREALRNHAIIEAVQALQRCGMKAATNDREPGPACDAVAGAFEVLQAKTVLNIWKSR